MKKTPEGWPRISSSVYYQDAPAAIDYLCRVFGFQVRLKVEGEGGRIVHSELTFGEGLVMVGSVGGKQGTADQKRSPRDVGGANTQALCVIVDDADAHYAQARAAGAKIVAEPVTNDYGADYWTDRGYEAEDLEGHHWYFMHRIR